MKKIYSVFGFYLIVALLAPYQTAAAERDGGSGPVYEDAKLTDAEKAESAKIALTVPIADLHDHDWPRKSLKGINNRVTTHPIPWRSRSNTTRIFSCKTSSRKANGSVKKA